MRKKPVQSHHKRGRGNMEQLNKRLEAAGKTRGHRALRSQKRGQKQGCHGRRLIKNPMN